MSISEPQKPFGTTNELAKERNRAAAERTINSWIGICLGLIGFGIAFDQITQSLRQRFPEANPGITDNISYVIGVIFIGEGIILLAIALIQHRLEIKTIERPDYVFLSVSTLNRIVIVGIVLLGLAVLFSALFLQ
jgi:putative membrane protein